MDTQTRSYIVFFDLDKTIISCNSGTFLVKQAYKTGAMSTGNLINAILQGYLYKYNLRNTNLIIAKMASWVQGLSYGIIDDLSKMVVDKYLIKNIRPEIIKEIDFHRKKNAGVAILSSAILSICEPMSIHMGIDYNVCSKLEVNDGILTGSPVGKFCFEDEKRIRLLAFCKENNFDPSEAWYYADSIADISALEAVGHPVCVFPDRKLSRIAMKKQWKIIKNVRS